MQITLIFGIACTVFALILTGLEIQKYIAKRKKINPYQYIDAIWYGTWRSTEEIRHDVQQEHRCLLTQLQINNALSYLLREDMIMHRRVPEVTAFGIRLIDEFMRTPPDFGVNFIPVVPPVEVHQ